MHNYLRSALLKVLYFNRFTLSFGLFCSFPLSPRAQKCVPLISHEALFSLCHSGALIPLVWVKMVPEPSNSDLQPPFLFESVSCKDSYWVYLAWELGKDLFNTLRFVFCVLFCCFCASKNLGSKLMCCQNAKKFYFIFFGSSTNVMTTLGQSLAQVYSRVADCWMGHLCLF